MNDLREFLWKIANDFNQSYNYDLVDEARELFLKYNEKLNTKEEK